MAKISDDEKEFLTKHGWKFCGVLYKDNGQAYGNFRSLTGARAIVGAREACWDGKSSFRKAVISAFIRRLKDEHLCL
jgi:hypothetical protein